MRVAMYARVSATEQSCELQLRDLHAYCAARGFDDVREYVDTGFSGAKDSRPALNELLGDARKRKIGAIVVWRFDRFARSTKHLLALEEFRGLGIQFIQENLDTASPLGQALFTIIAAVAQLERDLIRERVNAVIRNARANGTHLGRPRRKSSEMRSCAFRPKAAVCARLQRFWAWDSGPSVRGWRRAKIPIKTGPKIAD